MNLSSRRAYLSLARRTVFWLIIALEIVFLLGPIAITIVLSFSKTRILTFPPHGFSLQWYSSVVHSSQWTSSALVSLEISAAVMLLSAVIGVPAAYALTRYRFPGRSVVLGILMAPLIIPVILLGLGFAILLIERGYAATPEGLIFAQTIIAVPYMTLNCMISLQAIPRDLESAAASLGAGRVTTFRRVILPLMRRGMIAGAIFAFLASWDDATAVIFITGPRLTTLPVYLLTTVEDDLNPQVAAVAGFLFVLVLVIAAAIIASGGTHGTINLRRTAAQAPITDRAQPESIAS
jgi:putative spermidine/putrescine transport system permease protein